MSVSVYLLSNFLLLTLIINRVSSACMKVDNEEMIEYSCENGTLTDLYSIPERTEKIRIANIDLSHVTADTFGRFGDNLWVLSCSHCSIQQINGDAFKTLTNLQQLRLDNNNLRTVKAEWFQGLKYLTYLDFNYNEIETIEDGVFVNLPGLVDLRIAGNKLECLNVDEMSRLMDLKRVFLNRNPEFKCPNAVSKLMQSKNINYERDDVWEKLTHDLIQPKSSKLLSKILESVTETSKIYDRPESRTHDPRIYERPDDPRSYEIPEDPRSYEIPESRTEVPRGYERPESRTHDSRIYQRPETRIEDSRIYEKLEDPRSYEIPESRTEVPRGYERPETRTHDSRIYQRPETRIEDSRIYEKLEDPRSYEIPESRTEVPRGYGTPESMTQDPRTFERTEVPRIYEKSESITEVPKAHEISEPITEIPRGYERIESITERPKYYERPEVIEENPGNYPRPELMTEPPKIYGRFDLTNSPKVYENYETTPMYRERLIITHHNPELPSTSNINYPVTSIHYPTSVTYPDKSDTLPTSTYSRSDASRNFPDIPTPPVSVAVPQEPYNEPYYPRSSTFDPYNEINTYRLPTSTSKISWTSNSEDINTFDDIYYPIETGPLSREDNHNVNYPAPANYPTRPYEEEKEIREELSRLMPVDNPHTLENYQQVEEVPPVTIFTAEESTNGPITTTTDKPLPNCSSSASIGFGASVAILCFAVSHSILRTI